MASITEVARLAGRVDRDRVAGRLVVRLPGQRGDARAGPRGGPDARLRPERARPRACSRAASPVVGGHRPRHHRPVLRGGRPRRRGRRVGRWLPRDHLQLGADRRARAARTSGCCARSGRRPSSSPAAASTIRPSTRRSTGTSRRCGATARRSSTSRRMPSASRRSASTTPRGSPGWWPRSSGSAIAGSRSSPGPTIAVRRARAARRLPPRPGGRGHRVRRAARREHRLRRRRAARWRSTRCSAGERAVHGGLLRQRPAGARRAAAAGRARDRRSRRRCPSPASTTSRPPPSPRRVCRPSGCRCARSAGAAFEYAERLLAGGAAGAGEVLPTEVVLRGSTAAPPTGPVAAADAGPTTGRCTPRDRGREG